MRDLVTGGYTLDNASFYVPDEKLRKLRFLRIMGVPIGVLTTGAIG
jgi:hypothetical protein